MGKAWWLWSALVACCACGGNVKRNRASSESTTVGTSSGGSSTTSSTFTSGSSGGSAGNGTSAGATPAERHLFGFCSDECAEGLECVCGICSRSCVTDSDCSEVNAAAKCVQASTLPDLGDCGSDSNGMVCAIPCDDTEVACRNAGINSACNYGFCQPRGGCFYDGQRREIRESFAASDDCNQCTCGERGVVSCTELDCDSAGCEYEGTSYSVGARFRASDGCNYCGCDEGGIVRCTEAACDQVPTCEFGGVTYSAGETFPPDCNNCWCQAPGRAICTDDCDNYCPAVSGADVGYRDALGDLCGGCVCLPPDVLCDDVGCVSCTYEGENYRAGETWRAKDGCNTCTCTGQDLNGTVTCTEEQCATCTYGDQQHTSGQKFLADDGCNICQCEDSGEVSCSDRDCASNPACLEPFDPGDCDGQFSIYYFDENTLSCHVGTYGGCGGNDNKFTSALECERSCPVSLEY